MDPDVWRWITVCFTVTNLSVIAWRWFRYGSDWTAKTVDTVWVFGLWNLTALLATLDFLVAEGAYAAVRVVFVVAASVLTTVMLFKRYDDYTVATRPHIPPRQFR